MKKKITVVALAVALSISSAIGSVWLITTKFVYQPGEDIIVFFRTGTPDNDSNYQVQQSKVASLLHIAPNGVDADVTSQLTNDSAAYLRMKALPQDEGTHVIAFSTQPIVTTMNGAAFVKYLMQANMVHENAPIQTIDPNSDITVTHQICSKSLFHIGSVDRSTLTENYLQPTGIPIDIIPQQHPLALTEGGPTSKFDMAYKVLYKGAPLAKHPVKVVAKYIRAPNELQPLKTDTLEYKTDRKGFVYLKIRPSILRITATVLTQESNQQWQVYTGAITSSTPIRIFNINNNSQLPLQMKQQVERDISEYMRRNN